MLDIDRSPAISFGRRAGPGPATRPLHHRPRRRFSVEALEGRVLLSTWTVNSLGDTGTGAGLAGDLRYVITQVDQTPGDNTINFSITGTITLSSALPDLSNTTGLTDIEGPGAANLTVGHFTVDSGADVKLVGLTITGGNLGLGGGSGIANAGTLTITNSTIAGNSAFNGGGIENASGGTLTITNSTIANNSAYANGGGIANEGGTLTITSSTIAGNSTVHVDGGGVYNSGTLTVTNSTFSGNSAYHGNGGGIENAGGTLTVTNSTITNNAAIFIVFGGNGGGIDNNGSSTLNNTIVALNIADFPGEIQASDINGTVSSTSAYNLIGTGDSGGLVDGTNGNQVGVADPGLGLLADNGGPTQTIALLSGSPAIDMGSNVLAVDPQGNPLTTDQRGPGFVRIVNGTVDIGAYEFTPDANDSVAVGWGTQTASLQTAADGLRLLPAGRNTDIPWLGIDQLQLTLGQAQSLTPADVTINSAIGANYGPVTVSGSGQNYTITLAQPVSAADRVTIIIDNPGISVFYRRLDVLPGDINDDGVVNIQDAVWVRNQILGITPMTIFGDINGDGTVDLSDLNAVRKRLGTTLPPIT